MATQLAYSANVSRTPQTLDTQEFDIPADVSAYSSLTANITMPNTAASDADLNLKIRFQIYDAAGTVWKTGPSIEWTGGVRNPKTGAWYRPNLVETLEQFAGKRVKMTISVSKTASIGFDVSLI